MKVAGISFPILSKVNPPQFVLLNNLSKIDVDSITSLAAQLCSMPVSFVSFIDNDCHWFKSNNGVSFIEKSSDLHNYWQKQCFAENQILPYKCKVLVRH